MITAQELLNIVGYPQGKRELLVQFQSTQDIIRYILEQHEQNRKDGRKIAKYFNAATDYDVCRKLWNWVKENLNYIAEQDNQTVKTIPAILDDSLSVGNDCKHFSSFPGVILEALDIPFYYRFACYDNSKIPTHVYCVVPFKQREVIIDAVLPHFDSEKPYVSKIDIDVKKKKICHYTKYLELIAA